MTSLSLPVARRRFLAMLWLSTALHAAALGLTRLPPAVVPLSPELYVRLMQAPPAVATQPTPELKPAPLPPRSKRPLPQLQPKPEPIIQPAPQPRPETEPLIQAAPQPSAAFPAPQTQSVPSRVAPSREAPGPQFEIPLLVDTRYYSARELDVQPFALRKPKPVYPVQAEEQEVSGRVVVRLHLEADGSVSDTDVVSVMPAGVFGELFRKSTLDALKLTRFRPAQRNGQPVRAVVEIPVVFEPDR